jgi:6-phosphofructokinase 1
MVRLRREDLEDPHQLSRLAATAGLSPDEFRDEFGYLADLEPMPAPLPTPA